MALFWVRPPWLRLPCWLDKALLAAASMTGWFFADADAIAPLAAQYDNHRGELANLGVKACGFSALLSALGKSDISVTLSLHFAFARMRSRFARAMVVKDHSTTEFVTLDGVTSVVGGLGQDHVWLNAQLQIADPDKLWNTFMARPSELKLGLASVDYLVFQSLAQHSLQEVEELLTTITTNWAKRLA